MHHPVLENVPPFTSASTSGRMVFRSREVPVNVRSRHHSWLSNCRLVRSREHLVVRETNEFCLRTPDGTADFRIVHLALQRLLCRLFMKKLSDHRTRKATSEGCTSFFATGDTYLQLPTQVCFSSTIAYSGISSSELYFRSTGDFRSRDLPAIFSRDIFRFFMVVI